MTRRQLRDSGLNNLAQWVVTHLVFFVTPRMPLSQELSDTDVYAPCIRARLGLALPMQRLKELFNVNFSVVSQVQ